jgi:hypothetical protein
LLSVANDAGNIVGTNRYLIWTIPCACQSRAGMSNPTLSAEQAFQAMIRFLDAHKDRAGGRCDFVAVLSDIQMITSDGRPADTAGCADWLDAIDAAKDAAGSASPPHRRRTVRGR